MGHIASYPHQELGVPLDDHIAFCIQAMRAIGDKLGLLPPELATPAS
jgi:hypothetical protein